LVLDGFEEDKDGWAGPVFQIVVHGQRHPVGEHLLHHRLGTAQHQLRMFGADGLIHQPEEQSAEDAGGVFHVAHQSHHQQRRHINFVADAERSLRFQRFDEGQQEMFIADELLELHHSRVVIGPRSRQTTLGVAEDGMVVDAGEEDFHDVAFMVESGDAQ